MPKITVTISVPQRVIDRIARWESVHLANSKTKNNSPNETLSAYANQWFGSAGEFSSPDVDAFMKERMALPWSTPFPRLKKTRCFS